MGVIVDLILSVIEIILTLKKNYENRKHKFENRFRLHTIPVGLLSPWVKVFGYYKVNSSVLGADTF